MNTMKAMMAALVLGGVMMGSVGCEVSHTESTKDGWFGEKKHSETTVTKNPITGDKSVSHSESKVNP